MVTTTTCQAVMGFDSLRPLLQESPGQPIRMRSAPGPAQLRSAGIEPHAGGSGMGRVSVADDEVAGYRLRGLAWPERSYPAGGLQDCSLAASVHLRVPDSLLATWRAWLAQRGLRGSLCTDHRRQCPQRPWLSAWASR